MDNAAKALIMAGGILIAVMIISVALYVLTGARDFADAANDQATLQAIQSFNRYYQSFDSPIDGLTVLNIYNKAEDDYQVSGYRVTVDVKDSKLITGLRAPTGAELMDGTKYKFNYVIDGYDSDGRINHITISNNF